MKILDVGTELQRLYDEGHSLRFARLSSLQGAYRDLQVFVDGAGRSYYCSEEINEYVDQVDLTMTEGVVMARTFVSLPVEGRLYSNPPWHVVGYPTPRGFGATPLEGWREQLFLAGIGPDIRLKVANFFEARPPISYEV